MEKNGDGVKTRTIAAQIWNDYELTREISKGILGTGYPFMFWFNVLLVNE
jgi:hypothetical protein